MGVMERVKAPAAKQRTPKVDPADLPLDSILQGDCVEMMRSLPAASVDFVSSTNTLEHIPATDIGPILAECRRLLRPDGVVSCRIDMRDHYSYFDAGGARW